MTTDKKKYDLEERTARFGEAIIEFVRTLPKDSINNPLTSQIVRSGQASGRITWKRTEQNPKRIFSTKLPSAKRSRKKLNTGLE